MPTTYQAADEDVVVLLEEVTADHHPRLAAAGVRVGVLLADNPDGDAITSGGYPAFASVRVVSPKDRVSKNYDAELLIDERKWRELKAAQRVALLDHQLSHLDTVDLPARRAGLSGDPGEPNVVTWKTDDRGRPRLRAVKGDWNCGEGFRAVVARHGADAIEYVNLTFAKGRADQARREGERERGAGK